MNRWISEAINDSNVRTNERTNVQGDILTSMKWPGNDFVKRWVFSRWRKVDNDSADVTSAGRSFQIRGPSTGKARSATVDNLTGSTTRRLVPEKQEFPAVADKPARRLKSGSRVTQGHRKWRHSIACIAYDFQLPSHSNFVSRMHRFGDIVTYQSINQ